MRSLKRLSHKSWDVLRDIWIAHLPLIDFGDQFPDPTVSQLPSLNYPPFNASGLAELPYVEGLREAIFRESILLTRKFIYCGSLMPTLSGAGKTTWTAVAAYEAAFYGAKAFCYLLGIASTGRNSNVFVDGFYEIERRQGKQRIKAYDTLRFHKFEDRLTHEVLWALTARLIETTTFPEELRNVQVQLRLIDWDKFSSFRNRVYYDGSFWPRSAELAHCDLVKLAYDPQITSASFLADVPTSCPFADEYFFVATLFRKIIVGMLASLAELAPALRAEVAAFDVLLSATAPGAATTGSGSPHRVA